MFLLRRSITAIGVSVFLALVLTAGILYLPMNATDSSITQRLSATTSSSSNPFFNGSTSTTSQTASVSSTLSSAVSSSYTNNYTMESTSSQSLGPCKGVLSPINVGDNLFVQSDISIQICVKFYYYAVQSIDLNVSRQLKILGFRTYQNGTGLNYDASSNFTIVVSTANLTIGGSSSVNEGFVVEYTIGPKTDSNGTYFMNFGWLAPQIIHGADEFTLVSGDGRPNYANTRLHDNFDLLIGVVFNYSAF